MGSPRAALARRTSQVKREDVKDPDQVFADVSKRQFDRYERDFKPFEIDLIQRTQTDTSLIDRVLKMSSNNKELLKV